MIFFLQLTEQELQSLLVLLNRVQINGGEAETVVILKQKIARCAEDARMVVANGTEPTEANT